jgi:predicted ATPase/DNA-binding CsgD family transcriptional regulator
MTARDPVHQLEEFSSFVGRDHELAELQRLAGPARAVTLCGAGGIGKTRLALRLFATLAGDFPDGAWYVDLSELSQPEQVVPRVAATVGVAEEPGRPLLETLADTLRQRRALLALDNCEHLIAACAGLCQRLLTSAPGLKVIATSREPLRVAAESVWQVPPLSLPPANTAVSHRDLRASDSIALFAERASAASLSFALTPANAAGVAAICRTVDGLPLAIELAAAWTRVLSVDQIADRLSRRLVLLTSEDRSVPARQQTLRATFDWSYDLLSQQEQLLLGRLSVFAGWSLDMAEAVCADEQLPAAAILDLTTALADKSLIEVEPDALGEARYRMLETVREYAAGVLTRSGQAAALHRRQRDFTVAACEQELALAMATVPAPWSERVRVFQRVDLEEANLRETLAGCLADGDAEAGLRICTAMRPVWIVRGKVAEAAEWMDGFLALGQAGGLADAVRGPALAGRAQLAMADGSPQAEEMALAGLQLCRAAGSQSWVATALNLLTEIALHGRRLGEAADRAAQALTAARSAGDRWNEGYALGTMAAVSGNRGNLREAERLAAESLAILDSIGQLWGSARTLLGLGDLARLRADHEAARQHYLKALGILRELDARPDIARCLAGLGQIAIGQSDLPAARQHLSQSLQLSYLSGSRIGTARGLEAIARLAAAEQRPEVAVRLAGAVSGLRQLAGLPPAPGARTQRLLDAAAGLGELAIARLWAAGTATPPAEAVQLALSGPGDGQQPAPPVTPGTLARPGQNGPAGMLTQREREVVTLLGAGLSNRAIASELVISPATAARHVANILGKLGFSSRSQVAVWAATAAEGRPAATADVACPSG